MPLPWEPSDKIGNRYEANWTIYCLIRIYEGDYDSIHLEPTGDIGDKIEFILKSKNKTEFHQVKRQTSNGKWTPKSIKNILKAFYQKFNKDQNICCKFISTTSASELSELSERSCIYDFEIGFESLSKPLKKNFDNVCKILGIDLMCMGQLRGILENN